MRGFHKIGIIFVMILCFLPHVLSYPLYSYENSYSALYVQEEREFSLGYNNKTESDVRISILVEKIKDVSEDYNIIVLPIDSAGYVSGSSADTETETIRDEITGESFRVIKVSIPPLSIGEKYLFEVTLNDDMDSWNLVEENSIIKLTPLKIKNFANNKLSSLQLHPMTVKELRVLLSFSDTINVKGQKAEQGSVYAVDVNKLQDALISWKLVNISNRENVILEVDIEKSPQVISYPSEKRPSFKETNKATIIALASLILLFMSTGIGVYNKRWDLTRTQWAQSVISMGIFIFMVSLYLLSSINGVIISIITIIIIPLIWFWRLPNVIERYLERELHKDKVKSAIEEAKTLVKISEKILKEYENAKKEGKISDKKYNELKSFEHSFINTNKEKLKSLERIKKELC